MKLVLYSRKEPGEGDIKIVQELFKAGLKNYHIRFSKLSKEELKGYINQIPKRYHKRIIIHFQHDLCSEMHLKGIHFSRDKTGSFFFNLIKSSYLKIVNPKSTISCEASALDELSSKVRLFNYVILRNVFNSISKRRFRNKFDWTEIENTLTPLKGIVLARGGMTLDKIAEARNLGFSGIVLEELIWNNPDYLNDFKEAKERCSPKYSKILNA